MNKSTNLVDYALEGKTAVVYGAAGAIGSATAKAFAREGAFVFLAGRTLKSLKSVEAQIRESGGFAQSGVVDALDERSVELEFGNAF